MTSNGKFESFNTQDIKEYLYNKVMDSSFTDEEYGLFLDLRQYGKKALHMNKEISRQVLREMRSEYNGF